jgi:hypothetical protein
MDDARRLLGLATYPTYGHHRVEAIGLLPAKLIPGVAIPAGLAALGGVTISDEDGKLLEETLFFSTGPNALIDSVAYQTQLERAGWHSNKQPGPGFVFPGATTTLCKRGAPSLFIRSPYRALVIQVVARGCPEPIQPVTHAASVPYPTFSAPPKAEFGILSKSVYSVTSAVSAVTVFSSDSAPALLANFSKQMLAAGWQARAAESAGDGGTSFTIRDGDGKTWVATLAVVRISETQFVFNMSEFKQWETARFDP